MTESILSAEEILAIFAKTTRMFCTAMTFFGNFYAALSEQRADNNDICWQFTILSCMDLQDVEWGLCVNNILLFLYKASAYYIDRMRYICNVCHFAFFSHLN